MQSWVDGSDAAQGSSSEPSGRACGIQYNHMGVRFARNACIAPSCSRGDKIWGSVERMLALESFLRPDDESGLPSSQASDSGGQEQGGLFVHSYAALVDPITQLGAALSAR